MTLSAPNYLPQSMLRAAEVTYRWDDWNIGPFFDAFDEELAAKWSDLIDQAIGGLTIAMGEWVVFRLTQFDNDPQPLQILEAAWCANIDRRYCEGFELSRRDWLGRVRGPMMVAVDIIYATLYEALEGPDKPIEGPSLMSNLVDHVCDAGPEFQQWREQCIDRLRKHYVAPDPLEDLYGEQTDRIVVPREAFDPGFEFHPDDSLRLADRFIRSVDHTANPFLSSPQQMNEEGFEGTPYTLL